MTEDRRNFRHERILNHLGCFIILNHDSLCGMDRVRGMGSALNY